VLRFKPGLDLPISSSVYKTEFCGRPPHRADEFAKIEWISVMFVKFQGKELSILKYKKKTSEFNVEFEYREDDTLKTVSLCRFFY